jgi:hypothetical protein
MNLEITKAEVDTIMQQSKYIDTQIKWEDTDHEYIYEFRVPIKLNGPVIFPVKLFLKGSTNIALDRHTFSIICNGLARIKSLDIGKEHKNRCPLHPRGRVGKKHKHTWNNCCGDKWAYVPDDITDDAPLEQVFWEFLAECNITYNGMFPPPPSRQMELMLDANVPDDKRFFK